MHGLLKACVSPSQAPEQGHSRDIAHSTQQPALQEALMVTNPVFGLLPSPSASPSRPSHHAPSLTQKAPQKSDLRRATQHNCARDAIQDAQHASSAHQEGSAEPHHGRQHKPGPPAGFPQSLVDASQMLVEAAQRYNHAEAQDRHATSQVHTAAATFNDAADAAARDSAIAHDTLPIDTLADPYGHESHETADTTDLHAFTRAAGKLEHVKVTKQRKGLWGFFRRRHK